MPSCGRIDELAPAAVKAGPPLLLGDEERGVPQPLPISGVGLVEPASADFGTGRSLQDLGGRGLWFVVEIAGDHDRSIVVLGEQRGHV